MNIINYKSLSFFYQFNNSGSYLWLLFEYVIWLFWKNQQFKCTLNVFLNLLLTKLFKKTIDVQFIL